MASGSSYFLTLKKRFIEVEMTRKQLIEALSIKNLEKFVTQSLALSYSEIKPLGAKHKHY